MISLQKTQHVLILSTGRTGTVFLSNLFGQMLGQNAVVVHEGEGKERIINILTNMYFFGILPQAWFQGYLRGYLQRNTQVPNKFYIGVGPFMYGAPYIAPTLFKDYKIIHVIRDPRDFVTSRINQINTKPQSFFATKFIPFWLPPQKDMHLKQLQHWNPNKEFDKHCWTWHFKNTYIEKAKPNVKGTMAIHFEEIINSSKQDQAIEKILRFIGFDNIPLQVNSNELEKNVSHNKKMNSWQEWDNSLCYRLNLMCGEMMEHYGYGNEKDWVEKVRKGKMQLAPASRAM